MNTDRFKFRCWDETHKEYVPKCDLLLDARTGKISRASIFNYSFIVEQCTGLKDRNGKLIYEGDVVKQTYKDGTNLCTEVFYSTELCRWYLRKPYTNLHAVEYMVWDFCGSMADSLEVIGNIHDNQFRDITKKKQEIEE